MFRLTRTLGGTYVAISSSKIRRYRDIKILDDDSPTRGPAGPWAPTRSLPTRIRCATALKRYLERSKEHCGQGHQEACRSCFRGRQVFFVLSSSVRSFTSTFVAWSNQRIPRMRGRLRIWKACKPFTSALRKVRFPYSTRVQRGHASRRDEAW